MSGVQPGVTMPEVGTSSPVARRNVAVIAEFFSLYLRDKARFYSLWVEDDPEVVTPFVTDDVAVCQRVVHSGWDAVRAFWDPIHDEMEGQFDWHVDEVIPGEDPDVLVVRSHSVIDVHAGETWGNRHLRYNGRYVQIFRFSAGRIRSFEEYYDTAQLNAAYGG